MALWRVSFTLEEGHMVSAELRRHLDEQARDLFPVGGYELARAEIPRCGQMLAPRYTVQHLAARIRALGSPEELCRFVRTEALPEQRIMIAWAFVRISKAMGPDYEIVRPPSFIHEERLLQMSSLELCHVGFWLHLIAWPDWYCLSARDEDCGICDLDPPR